MDGRDKALNVEGLKKRNLKIKKKSGVPQTPRPIGLFASNLGRNQDNRVFNPDRIDLNQISRSPLGRLQTKSLSIYRDEINASFWS